MRRLIDCAHGAIAFTRRCMLAHRYMRRLNYSRKLAWAMAAR